MGGGGASVSVSVSGASVDSRSDIAPDAAETDSKESSECHMKYDYYADDVVGMYHGGPAVVTARVQPVGGAVGRSGCAVSSFFLPCSLEHQL